MNCDKCKGKVKKFIGFIFDSDTKQKKTIQIAHCKCYSVFHNATDKYVITSKINKKMKSIAGKTLRELEKIHSKEARGLG